MNAISFKGITPAARQAEMMILSGMIAAGGENNPAFIKEINTFPKAEKSKDYLYDENPHYFKEYQTSEGETVFTDNRGFRLYNVSKPGKKQYIGDFKSISDAYNMSLVVDQAKLNVAKYKETYNTNFVRLAQELFEANPYLGKVGAENIAKQQLNVLA